MIKVYKVFNPYNGLYIDASNRQELVAAVARQALDSYVTMCHGKLYSEVDVNIDGTQIWKGVDNPIITDEEIHEEMQQSIDQILPGEL